MEQTVESFLKHHGVKGMKWGVTKTQSTSTASPSSAKKTASQSSNFKQQRNDALKYASKELAWGSVAPAAMIAGLGPPISVTLGITIGVLRSPQVSGFIKSTSKASAGFMKEVSQTKLSAMREAKEARAKLKAAAKSVDEDLIKKLANSNEKR